MRSKINISFLNLAAQSPSVELNFAISEKTYLESNHTQHVFFMCDSALTSCSLNVLNRKSICNICRYKARKGFKHFNSRNKNSVLIPIKRQDLKYDNSLKNNRHIHNEILLGVHSTIGSQLRLDDMSLLDKRWSKIKDKMIESSFGLYSYFNNFLKLNSVENFIIFNGRISCARPLKVVAENNNVDYILFDGAVNGMTPYFAKNEMFHSIEFEKHNALKSYLKYFKISRELANEYSYKKINKIPILRDVVFTKNQIKGFVDPKILEIKKPIVSIFVSSDDEYRFLGSDFGKDPIVDQIQAIKKLIRSNLTQKYTFIVKMHPNQGKSHLSILKKYQELSETVMIVFPDNKTDTYSLIDLSSIIINFSSSIGAEVNYLRKPVVQIGPSKWMGLPTANFVKNAEQAIMIISQNKFKLMPQRSSIAYFTFNMRPSFKLDSYKYISDGVFTYGDKFIKAPFFLRLIAIYDKLVQSYLKGDKEIFSKLYLYVPNLIFGTTKTR